MKPEKQGPPLDDLRTWHPRPEPLTLPAEEVHVWRASLFQLPDRLQALHQTLTPDEQQRAARFYFQRDRERFTAARGFLRAILGRYLSRDPAELRFTYTAHGKPMLVAKPCPGFLRFNVTHSHGLALYAVARDRELGVDLERIRPEFRDEAFAERFFAPREAATLRALPDHLRKEAFFTCWTRKEAYIKAMGKGLALPLDGFEVSLAPGEPAALVSVHEHPEEVQRWSLRELHPGPGYVGAVVVEGASWRLWCGQWPDGD